MKPIDENELRERFLEGCIPNENQQKIRDGYFELAKVVLKWSDTNREQSLAITNLEQSMFWALQSEMRQ